MKDAAFATQKARIQKIAARWRRWLLPGWTFTTHYCDDRDTMPKGASREALAACEARSEYLSASISWYMPEVEKQSDGDLETALVHEMGHAMVNEMRLKGVEHEERVVTELTRTLFWVRDNAEKLKEKNMEHGKHHKGMHRGSNVMSGGKKGTMAKRKVTNPSPYNKWFHEPENSPHFLDGGYHGLAESEVGYGLIPAYPSYLDQYLGSTGELHLHFSLLDNRTIGKRPVRPLPADYCAVFGKAVSRKHLKVEGDGLAPDGYNADEVLDSAANDDKLTVLISIFEATDSSEDGAECFSSQVIGLNLYDQCPSLQWQSADGGLKVSPLGGIDHELSVRVLRPDILRDDWELGVLAPFSRDGGNNDMVKCTSQIVYEVTEHNGNHGIRLLSDSHTIPDLSLAVRVLETSKLVRVATSVAPGFSIDVYHVLLGALDLEPPGVGHVVSLEHERQPIRSTEAEDAQGIRDSDSKQGRRRPRTKKGGAANQAQAINSHSPPGQVGFRTSPAHRRGASSAKHTRSGSPEDA